MKEEMIDLNSIDQKFLEIKNRLSSQKPKIFEMEQVSNYEKMEGQMDTHGTSNLGEMSKYRVEMSDKKVLTEKNSFVEKCESEYSVQPNDQNGKENKQMLQSYQSTFRQNNIQDYFENKRASEIDPYSALLINSECSKTSTFVVYPKVEDYQSSTTLQKIQKEFPSKSKVLEKKQSIHEIDEQVISRDEKSTKYNFFNEGDQLTFKEEVSNMYYSEADQSMKQTSQKSYKFQRILGRQEADNLNVDEKHEYIQFLKNEISQELKKEQKYKQLQEEIQVLNKNFKLEKELLHTEQDNRKLQIWILEDKKKQTLIEYDSKQNERNDFMNMQNEMKKKIEQTKILTQEKIQLIQQIQIELENSKKEQVQLYFNQENLKVQKQNLKSEFEDQNYQLNQFLYKKNEIQNLFDLSKQKEDHASKNLENQTKSLFFKETSILGFKKEMKRIEDDIQEANLVKQTIKEEKDMYETQLSFLQKQKIIFGRDIENLQKKKKFQDDFIRYGDKNNDSLFDSIKESKTQIGELQEQNVDLNNQIQSLQSEYQKGMKESEKIQDYLLKLEDNTKQIIEITKFQDKIFKDSESYEKMRSTLISLLNLPKMVQSFTDSKHNESCRPAANQVQESKNQISESRIKRASRSNKDTMLNISNVQDAISVKFQKNQNLENQETKRVFSDRCLSPIEKESQNSNGFMGLGKSFIQKNKGKNVDLIFYEEFGNDDQASQVTQEEQSKVQRVQQKDHKQMNFKNIDKISKITSQHKLQSPFTVRSIIGGQVESNYEQNQVQQNGHQHKTSIQMSGMPYKKNVQKTQNVTNDLKSFLTKQTVQNNFGYKQETNINTQDRMKMVNQIRSCSPLKIFGAATNVKQSQNKNVKIAKKQVIKKQSKDEYEEFVIFNKIQQKNQMIKNGQIKHLIYLDESFINKNSSRKQISKAEDFYEDLQFENIVFQSNEYDNNNNFQGFQKNFKTKPYAQEDLNKNNKKQFSSFQMNKKQNSELQNQRNAVFSDQQNQKYKAEEIQKQNYYNEEKMISKSRPFRKSISPKQLSSQNSSEQKGFAQAVKMTIMQGYQKESEAKKIYHNPNIFIQQNQNQQISQKNEMNQFKKDSQGYYTHQKKVMGTASKIETQRDRQPIIGYFENKKQFSNSLAENNAANYKPERDQARAAPLRKSISQRREDYEKKSDYQSVNFQASSNQQSYAIQNQQVYNGKQAPKIEQQSVKSQQIKITPPIPAFKKKQIDFSKQSEEINEININSINRDFDQSLKSTRTHCANIPNKLLNNQEFMSDVSFQNGNQNKKKGSYPVKENGHANNVYVQNQYKNHTDSITFKKSQNSQSGSQYRNEIQINDVFIPKPKDIFMNLKSNFARKSIDCPLNDQRKLQQNHFEIKQNEDKNNQDSLIQEIQHQNHNALNAIPQLFSSFQNNSIYQEFTSQQDNDGIKLHNYNKYSKPETQASAEFNKYTNSQPVYEQNYNKYQNVQASQNKLNLKSNFSKSIYEQCSQLQNQNANIQCPLTLPINHRKSVNSSPRQLSTSGQSKFSKQMNLFDQVKKVQNTKNENQSQNQFQLDKMHKELKHLQSQIGDGLKFNEPKSALLGNYNRDLLKNDHCFSGSDIYIEPMNLNTQRLDCMPPINYRLQNQMSESFQQSQFAGQNADSQSCMTMQTKSNNEKHNISQGQNLRISQITFESRSELSNIVHIDHYDIKNKFRQLQDDLNDDGRISECEQESCNTYLSLRDQADIISQLRQGKESKKLN